MLALHVFIFLGFEATVGEGVIKRVISGWCVLMGVLTCSLWNCSLVLLIHAKIHVNFWIIGSVLCEVCVCNIFYDLLLNHTKSRKAVDQQNLGVSKDNVLETMFTFGVHECLHVGCTMHNEECHFYLFIYFCSRK